MRRAIPTLGLAALLAGCGGEGDPLAPVELLAAEEDGGTTLPDAGNDAEPPPATPKRSVIQRNPYGNVAETENLLWDGDFEWSSPFSDQYGWLSGTGNALGYDFPGVTVGPACRSGIKCVTLTKGRVLVGIGVAATGSAMQASFWVKPKEPSCEGMSAMLIALFDPQSTDAPLAPVAATPGPDGWCQYGVLADERPGKTYLYIKNLTGDDVLVDDAVMKKASAGSPLEVAPPWVPTVAELAEVDEVRVELRRRTAGPHDPPPNAAHRAFEAWRKK